MKFLIDILKEELNNSKSMKKEYEKQLESLLKGNIYIKKIKCHKYYYLQYKENNEQFSRCLGKLNRKDLEALSKKIRKRKLMVDNLNKVNKQIQILNDVINDKRIRSAA